MSNGSQTWSIFQLTYDANGNIVFDPSVTPIIVTPPLLIIPTPPPSNPDMPSISVVFP